MRTSDNRQRVEARRSQRAPVKAYADLQWEGTDGTMRFVRARCLDISESGIRIEVSGEIPARGALVHVRLDKYGFQEYGVVRHAHQRGAVGVEFRFEGAFKKQVDLWKSIVQAAVEKQR